MISAKLAYRISLVAGLVVVALAIVLVLLPMPQCGSVVPRFIVVSEELARSKADLIAIFGPQGSGCQPGLAHALNVQTWIDSLGFIPAYGVFLLFFFLAMVPRDEQSALIGFVLSAVAMVADYIENVCLFQLTTAPYAPGFALSVIPWATGIKWLALGLAGAVGGTVLIRSGRQNYPAAAACALGFLGTILGVANPHLFDHVLVGAVTLSWIVFLVVDIRAALFAEGSAVAQLEVEDGAA